MKHETRANLIFLLVFLVFCLPGGVILFNKKMQPDARKMYLPDPVRHTLAFNDPKDAVAKVQRVVPAETVAWVATLAGNMLPQTEGVNRGNDRGEVRTFLHPAELQLADTRRVQLLWLAEGDGQVMVGLLLWSQHDGAIALHAKDVDGRSQNVAVDSQQVVAVPEAVQASQRDLGYTRPPKHVRQIVATIANTSHYKNLSSLTVEIGQSGVKYNHRISFR